MERRDDDRRPHRIQVFYWPPGAERRSIGYTKNISTSGMYITTNRLLRKGTRIRVELRSGDEHSVMVEAVVTRAERSLHQLHPNAMGVRFLTTEELVHELIPEIGSTEPGDRAPTPEGVFQLHFADHQQFLVTYRRDLSTGGLFIPSDEPAPLDEVVKVELQVAAAAPVQFEARVVQRFEPGDGNLMAGMGVQLLNFENTLVALKALAASLEQG